MGDSDKARGLYPKYNVHRLAPDQTGKHADGCQYFVLDVTHDPLAREAVLAYAAGALEAGYEALAADLVALVDERRDAH